MLQMRSFQAVAYAAVANMQETSQMSGIGDSIQVGSTTERTLLFVAE